MSFIPGIEDLNIENPNDLLNPANLFGGDNGNILGNLVQQVGSSITLCKLTLSLLKLVSRQTLPIRRLGGSSKSENKSFCTCYVLLWRRAPKNPRPKIQRKYKGNHKGDFVGPPPFIATLTRTLNRAFYADRNLIPYRLVYMPARESIT